MIQTEHNYQLTVSIIGEEFIKRINETNIPPFYALQATLRILASVLRVDEKNYTVFEEIINTMLEKYFKFNQNNN